MEECVAFVVLCSVRTYYRICWARTSVVVVAPLGGLWPLYIQDAVAVGEFRGVMISVSCSPYVVTIEMNFSGSPASFVGRPGQA